MTHMLLQGQNGQKANKPVSQNAKLFFYTESQHRIYHDLKKRAMMTVVSVNVQWCLSYLAGVKIQTAAMSFGWNEMHQTSFTTCKPQLNENWLGLYFKMWGLSGDDASGCKLLHIPGVLQSTPAETQRQAVVNTLLSTQRHTLVGSFSLFKSQNLKS